MSDPYRLAPEERALLFSALEGPISDPDANAAPVCLNLCGRRLLQRAGDQAADRGWRGSPHAFVLTREGWEYIKAERPRGAMRHAG